MILNHSVHGATICNIATSFLSRLIERIQQAPGHVQP